VADRGGAQELETQALAGESRSSEKLQAGDASLSRRIARYLSIAALVLPFVIALEITCRLEDRIANGIPFLSRVTQPAHLILIDSVGARGRPNARFGKWHLNSMGFRGPEIVSSRRPGSLRVVVEGASETFGLYEAPDKEFPRQLEDSLRQRTVAMCGAQSGDAIEVINGALPGMSLPSMVRHVESVVAPLHPDVIVLYPSPGFYLDVEAPRATTRPAASDTSLPAANALQLRVTDRLRTQLKSLVPEIVLTRLRRRSIEKVEREHPSSWKIRSVPEERVALFESDLRSAVGVARQTGARVILLGHVNETMFQDFNDPEVLVAWEKQFPNTTGETLADFHRRAREISLRVARDSSVDLVDPTKALEGHWRQAFADFVHFTDFGAATIAGQLVSRLVAALPNSGLCKSSSAGGSGTPP
jgi:hypothetical protein